MQTKYPNIKELLEDQRATLTSIQGETSLETAIILIDVLCERVLEMSRNIEDLKFENRQLEKTLEKSVDDLQDKIYHIESQLSDLRNS